MNHRNALLAILAVSLFVAGCGSSNGTASAPARNEAVFMSTPSPEMTTGTSMPPGMAMPAGRASTAASPPETPAPRVTDGATPSASAQMICGPETKGNVASLAGRNGPVPSTTTWADHLYTCSYELPQGPLVISVKESSDLIAARSYFDALQTRDRSVTVLSGLESLGFPSYKTPAGRVVFLKDNMTLVVDAASLPALVGPSNTGRTSFAYTIASDILACWQGS